MNSKKYLEQLRRIQQAMIANCDERDWLEEVSTASGAIHYNNDRTVGSMRYSAKWEIAVDRKEDLQNKIMQDYTELLNLHEAIRKVIFAVEDIDARNVLVERYLCNKEVDVIAAKFRVSRKTIERRLWRGYDAVSKLTGYPVPNRMPAQARKHETARRMMKEVYDEQIH